MNKEYLYLNGKCVVYDQNGAIKDKEGKIDLKDYNSNFDEILVQENIIEELEDSLEETTKEIEKRKKLVKSDKHTIWFNIISYYYRSFGIDIIYKYFNQNEYRT